MQISKKNVNKQVEKRIFKSLYQVLADLRKPDEVEKFLGDILSETETTVLAKRLGIAWYLNKKMSYDLIRKDLKVSSATIATVRSWLEKDSVGLKLAIKAIEADEWAGEMANKVKQSVKKIFKK
ncbi:MAG: Trp family transcriptional regulator [Candidatus Beckwithbacteria bacterium]|nr:Trp family transcriptional regulator [Candidatus Beckwithbacteria bacterium]